LAWLYRHGRVTDRTPDEPDGLLVTARLDPQALGRFEQLRPGALR
jgi:GTP-binding protein HflX